MKILHNCIAGYLGYYGSLEALQSQYPEGGEAGSFFLNGETSTLWMWNPVTQCWNDTNYTTAPDLVGMIIEPSTFVPSIIPGKEALYYYVATAAGSYGFPKLPGTSIKIEVSCTQPSIILLRWDGTKWEEHVYPLLCHRSLITATVDCGTRMKPTAATTTTSMLYFTTGSTTVLSCSGSTQKLHPTQSIYGKSLMVFRYSLPDCR